MELFDKIRNPLMRKLFGKKEIEIVQKQLFGISLTPSEQTIISRDIRKKFLAIKELFSCQKDFNLKKGILPIQMVQKVKDRILNSIYGRKIKRIIWFGSFVSGRVTFNSDIDLSVEFDEINLKDSLKFCAFASQEDMLDVVVYNHIPKKLKKEVDNGRIVYKK